MQPFIGILTSVLFMLDDMWNLHSVCTMIILKVYCILHKQLSCKLHRHYLFIFMDTTDIIILFGDNILSFGLSNIMASFHYLVITHCMHHNPFKTACCTTNNFKYDFRLYNHHHLSYFAYETFIQFINTTSKKHE